MLDDIGAGRAARRAIARARGAGLRVEQARFFAGHLKLPDGESAYLAAFRQSTPVAMRAARARVGESRVLTALAAEWPRTPMEIRLARQLWWPVMEALLRVRAAQVLAGGGPCRVIAARPAGVRAEELDAGAGVQWYDADRRGARTDRFVLAWWIRQRARGVTAPKPEIGRRGLPIVLAPQEEEIEADLTFRTQPHWRSTTPRLDAVIAATDVFGAGDAAPGAGLSFVRPDAVHGLPGTPVTAAATRAGLRIARAALSAGRDETPALGAAARLFYFGGRVAALAAASGARVFVCCESPMIHADAAQLVARKAGIRTVCFQYSNMGHVTPVMKSCADVFASFAPIYHERWQWDGWDGECRPVGYPYDYAFPELRRRAAAHREALAARGARFVIAYFDESVQHDKWGLIHPDDHVRELGMLLRRVIDDGAFGLVLKNQFQRNAATKVASLTPLLAAARETGRLLELSHGRQRNRVFPAEAALAADITIGHAVGATASLEAVLAGTRAVLLNPYGYRGANDAMYARADIVYPDLERALAAIDRWRAGDPAAAAVGDWSGIADAFDAFRDGLGAARLEELLLELAS